MANPSISMPDDVLAEADERNSSASRSQYVTEALVVRFLLEDDDEWREVFEQAVEGREPYRESTVIRDQNE